MPQTGTTTPNHEYVAILDAGSQFGKVIDRKIRELKVETKILPLDTSVDLLKQDSHLKGIIISGGPSSVYGADAPAYHPELFTALEHVPILGICYGMQLMSVVLGGRIERKSVREDGQETIQCDTSSSLFHGLDASQLVLLTHGDSVVETGPQLRVVARSPAGIIAAVEHLSRPLYGVQFHPEVDLSVHGVDMFRNFLVTCNCTFSFTMEDREALAIAQIRERTSQGQRVLCLASGGVDSTVCAALLLKALGPERVICIHIDHGFMREGESSAVVTALGNVGVVVHRIDAANDFAHATTTVPAKGSRAAYTTKKLCDCVAPEDKRHIIGNTFMSVCDKVIKDMNLKTESLLLAQGTLRPDLIESGSHVASSKADAIKTHHNDTEVVRVLRAQGKIIEPLCDYHKDEVRELGRNLGLPEELVMRQPFPGPGLAIRTLCLDEPAVGESFEATKAWLTLVQQATHPAGEDGSTADQHQVLDPLRASMSTLELCAVVLPIRTVGVQGDGRTYSNAVALTTRRNVGGKISPWNTVEEWKQLLQLARRIPQLAHHVNRVVFMFGDPVSVSPEVITPTTLTPEVLSRIRAADDVVGKILMQYNLVKKLSQVPVVLVPLGFEKTGGHSVVIRTFLTSDFMTGIPATPGTDFLPLDALDAMVTGLLKLPFVGRVMFDLTAKPPGTTEWE